MAEVFPAMLKEEILQITRNSEIKDRRPRLQRTNIKAMPAQLQGQGEHECGKKFQVARIQETCERSLI